MIIISTLRIQVWEKQLHGANVFYLASMLGVYQYNEVDHEKSTRPKKQPRICGAVYFGRVLDADQTAD
jgi:hypothetical protein